MNINLMHQAKIRWPEEFRDFHNLIYTKFDLPNHPILDEDKFLWWSQKSEAFLKNQPVVQTFSKVNEKYTSAYHDNLNVRKTAYPFTLWPIITKVKSETDDKYVEGFDKLFPDFLDYVAMFPGNRIRSLGFIKQNTNLAVWDHTDADEWLGFRFYFKNTVSNNRLYFKKIKPEYRNGDRYTTYIELGNGEKVVRDFEGLVEEDRIYTKNNLGNYAWGLTSANAVHGIDTVKESEDRITTIIEFWPFDDTGVVAGYKIKETRDLLERSLSKYGNEAIWYK